MRGTCFRNQEDIRQTSVSPTRMTRQIINRFLGGFVLFCELSLAAAQVAPGDVFGWGDNSYSQTTIPQSHAQRGHPMSKCFATTLIRKRPFPDQPPMLLPSLPAGITALRCGSMALSFAGDTTASDRSREHREARRINPVVRLAYQTLWPSRRVPITRSRCGQMERCSHGVTVVPGQHLSQPTLPMSSQLEQAEAIP